MGSIFRCEDHSKIKNFWFLGAKNLKMRRRYNLTPIVRVDWYNQIGASKREIGSIGIRVRCTYTYVILTLINFTPMRVRDFLHFKLRILASEHDDDTWFFILFNI
uniref:Uncharacterized protein n=1 Tax=Cacopsylla melanoneura TaxID=428564 RepID=A0A8D9ASF0_9HEMI